MTAISTEHLDLMEQNNTGLLRVKGNPHGPEKQTQIYHVLPNGKAYCMRNPAGDLLPRVLLSQTLLNSFIDHSLVTADGPEDDKGHILYRLTEEGRAAAKAAVKPSTAA